MVEQSTNNILENVYKFNAKELDTQKRYYYYGARYYDPGASIFLSVDPLAEQFPAWNPYHYVHNNPINLVDPTGMAAEDSTGKDDWFVNNKNGNVIKVGGVSDLSTLSSETLEKYELGDINNYTRLGKDDMFGDIGTPGLKGRVSDYKNIKMNGESENFMKNNDYYLGWDFIMEEQQITSGGRMGSENYSHKVGSIKKLEDVGYTYAKLDQFYQKKGITEVASDVMQYMKVETVQYRYTMRLYSPTRDVEPFFESNKKGMSRDVPLNIVKSFVEAFSDLIGK